MEEHADGLRARHERTLLHVARENCRIKGSVVEKDPHENGLRRILNYGHTVGHAIEKLMKYRMLHGYCVSIGMIVAGRIANQVGMFSSEYLQRQEALLKAFGLPTKIPRGLSDDDIIATTAIDKKAAKGTARYSLPEGIGRMGSANGEYAYEVHPDAVRIALKESR